MNLKEQLKDSQKHCEQLMGYIDMADTAYDNSGVETFGARNRRKWFRIFININKNWVDMDGSRQQGDSTRNSAHDAHLEVLF